MEGVINYSSIRPHIIDSDLHLLMTAQTSPEFWNRLKEIARY